MNLNNGEKNREYQITDINIVDERIKLRLYELGFFVNGKVMVLNRTIAKKTILVSVLDSCFIIKSDIAKSIEVEYG